MDELKDNTELWIVMLQYEKNKKEWNKYKNDKGIVSVDGYIENQNALMDMRFGSVDFLTELLFF